MLDYLMEGTTILVVVLALTTLGRQVIRRVPVLADSRSHNRREDKARLSQPKYGPVLRRNGRAGIATLGVLIFAIAPFFSSFAALPWWRFITDTLAILLLADLSYYFVHRFLFHGHAYFKRIHGVHHQARVPSHIDAHYAHPLETVLGLLTLVFAVVIVGGCTGGMNVIAVGVVLFLYIQLNILIHAQVNISAWPFRWATWVARKHRAHHTNMRSGNYATLMLFYDRVFGTLV